MCQRDRLLMVDVLDIWFALASNIKYQGRPATLEPTRTRAPGAGRPLRATNLYRTKSGGTLVVGDVRGCGAGHFASGGENEIGETPVLDGRNVERRNP